MAGASRVTIRRSLKSRTFLDARPPTVVGAVGVSERGPLERTTITSWEEYQQIYGGLTANSDLALFVYLAYQEAGKKANLQMEIVRTVHFGTPGDPTTKTSEAATLTLATPSVAASAGAVLASNVGPYDLSPGDTLVISIDGGGSATATFSATAASRTSGSTGNVALSNNDTLQLSINGGTTLTKSFLSSEFSNIGTATPSEIINSINAFLAANNAGALATVSAGAVVITSNRRGTSSGVNIIGGTANAGGKLNFTTGNQAGTGNVADIDAVTVAEIETIVEGAVAGAVVTNVGGAAQIATNTLGAGGSIQVLASSTADDELGFDNAVHAGAAAGTQDTLRVDGKTDGSYANALSVRRSAATSGQVDHFDFAVIRAGIVVESWINASMNEHADDYIVRLVNEGVGSQPASNLITVTDLNATVDSPYDIPAAGTFGPLTGGDDGLVGLDDNDFVGGSTANGKTGLRVFDSAERVPLVLVPGRATAAVHNAMITYSEVTREAMAFALLDPPANQTAAQIRTYVTNAAQLKGLSENSTMYWPRILVDNPSTSVFGRDKLLTVAPSGPVVGMIARVDASKIGGAFEHPAGRETGRLFTARGLEGEADGRERNDVRDEGKRGQVFDDLINPIMSKRGKGVYVDGARCLKSDGNFPTVGESRGVVFVSLEIKDGLDPKRHKNIRQRLLNDSDMSVREFLKLLTDKECFASKKYEEAFFLDTGKALNTDAETEARRVRLRFGIATSKPCEFFDVEIGDMGLQAAFEAA